MPDSFDPFHEWLGIPPRDQPANHYRLLGLKLFEADREVIKRAADRQTSVVERLRPHDHPQAAAALLEQLAEARRCLLDRDRKQLYDEGLRDGQKAEWKRSRLAADRPAVEAADGTATNALTNRTAAKGQTRPIEGPSVRPSAPARRPASTTARFAWRAAARRSRRKLAAVVGGVAVGVFVVTLALFLWRKEPPAAPTTIQPSGNGPEVTQTASRRPPPDLPASNEVSAAATTATRSGADGPPRQATAPIEAAAPHKQQPPFESLDATSSKPNEQLTREDGQTANITSAEPFPYDGLILWLDAADQEWIEADADRRLKVWYDGSRAGHHSTATAETAAPLLVPLSKDLSVVRFSGAQSLTIEEAAAFNVGDDYSILLVARGDTGVLLDKGDGYNEGAFSLWNGVTSLRTHKRTLKSGATPNSNLQVHSLIADERQVRWHIDGTLRREIAGPHTIDNEAPFLIGCREKEDDPRYFVGDIAELLIYDRSLSSGEQVAVEEYLLQKWLPVSGDADLTVTAAVEQPDPSDRTADAARRDPDAAAVGDESLLAPRGAILREVWLDVPGSSVEEFTAHVAEHPEADEQAEIDRLEVPEDFADNYGQRLSGYLHPPITGEYRFSLRANAGGLIYVSTDVRPENKRLIEPGTPVEMQGDTAYYFEAYHKESTGRDYLSVGWTMPDGTEENPIPGDRLSVRYRIAPRHQTQFVPLRLVSAEASAGSQLTADDDGRIFVTAAAKGAESYHLLLQPPMKRLTALRLEALPHTDLPAKGPGLGAGGRFAIDEAVLHVLPGGESDEKRRVEFAKVAADNGADLMRLDDGNEATSWTVSGRGKAASATFFPAAAILVADARLLLTIKNRERLASFRICATSARDPEALGPPATGSATDAFLLHVNLGGETHTAPDGIVWKASKHFDNQTFGHEGGRSVREDDVLNPVQGSAMRGIQAFRAMVPEGTYEVTLYFCEYWSTQSAARTFSIAAEQRLVVRNMDLLRASGGFGRPLAYPIRNSSVQDGRLDIEFQPSQPQSSAILNAIRIRQVQ